MELILVEPSQRYTTLRVRHLLSRGQVEGLGQLHKVVLRGKDGGVIFLILEAAMFCAMFGVVEYESLTVFRLNIL